MNYLFFFFFNNLCLVRCLRASSRAVYFLIHIEWWSRTYCELVETEMERVCPLSISSVYVCLVQNNLIAPTRLSALFFLSSLSHAYICSRVGLRRQSTLLSCLNYLLFVPYFSDLVQSTEKSWLDNERWRKIFPVYGVISIR